MPESAACPPEFPSAGGRHRRRPEYRGRHRKQGHAVRNGAAATGALTLAAAGELLAMTPAGAATAHDFYRLRVCESSDNYQANTGNGYYGAYQFDVLTWRGLGYSGLPSAASPAVQDAAARRLQSQRGWQPWPACSRRLGLTDSPARASRGTTRHPLPTHHPARPAPAHRHGAAHTGHQGAFHPQAAPHFPGTLLRTSMVGQVREDVRRWQREMAARGWRLTVDGRYGPESAAVCTAFERAKGLEVESPGVVGPQVWHAAFASPLG